MTDDEILKALSGPDTRRPARLGDVVEVEIHVYTPPPGEILAPSGSPADTVGVTRAEWVAGRVSRAGVDGFEVTIRHEAHDYRPFILPPKRQPGGEDFSWRWPSAPQLGVQLA